jgi:hypothetical protein
MFAFVSYLKSESEPGYFPDQDFIFLTSSFKNALIEP